MHPVDPVPKGVDLPFCPSHLRQSRKVVVADDLGIQMEQTTMSLAPDTRAKKLPSSLESPVEGRNATLVECKKKLIYIYCFFYPEFGRLKTVGNDHSPS